MAVRDWGDFRLLPFASQKQFVSDLRYDGYSDAEIREMFGVCESTWKRWVKAAGMYRHEPTRAQQKRNTLCWKCAKALGYCSWSHHFEPVEGWEAIIFPPAPYEQGKFAQIPSYKVISCPEFIQG